MLADKSTQFVRNQRTGERSQRTEDKDIIQSEVSQKEKNKYRMLTHIYGILKKKKKVMKNLGAGQE